MATTFHRLFLQMLQRGIIHSFTSMKPCHLGSKTDAMLERFKLRLLSNFWCCCYTSSLLDHPLEQLTYMQRTFGNSSAIGRH